MGVDPKKADILLIEDNKHHAELIREILRGELTGEIVWVDNSDAGLDEIVKKSYQCILLDYDMPGKNGLQLLKEVKHHTPDVPVILFTGMGSEELAAQAIKMGAYDYIPKGQNLFGFKKLSLIVEKAIENYHLREALKKTEARYQAILKSTPLPIIEYGTHGDLIIKESVRKKTSAVEAPLPLREPEEIPTTPTGDYYSTRVFYERNLLNTILSTTHVFLIVFDMKGNTIIWNRMAEEISGYSQEEINTIDKVFRHLYPEYRYRASVLSHQHEMLSGMNREENYESSITTKNGELYSFSWSTSTVLDHHGEIAFIINAGIDVTDSKIMLEQREAALHELQERVNEISCLYNISKSMEESRSLNDFLYDTVANICQALRYSADAQVKITLRNENFTSPKFKATPYCLERPITSGGEKVGRIFVCYRNKLAFTKEEINLVENISETVSRYIEKQELEQKVLESEKYLESVFNATGDIITVLDLDCNILAHNQTLTEMEGKSFVGKKCYEIIGGDQQPCEDCIAKASLGTGYMMEGEFFLEGSGKWYHRQAYPHLDQEGTLRSIITVTRDITEWKIMQEKLRRIDKLASIGRMAAGVAHEIKNPLAGISSMAQILAENLPNDGEQQFLLEDILHGIERIDYIVQKTLDFSRPTPPTFALGKITDPLNSTLKLLGRQASSKNIRILRQIPKDLPPVYFDVNQMEEMFINLINNAIDAMPKGGLINIEFKLKPPIPEWERYNEVGEEKHSNNDYLYISISDEGVGIPVEDRQKVFEPFYSRNKRGGTGLGLSLTHTIIEEHKGDIALRSTEGRGTTFYIRLPVNIDADPSLEPKN